MENDPRHFKRNNSPDIPSCIVYENGLFLRLSKGNTIALPTKITPRTDLNGYCSQLTVAAIPFRFQQHTALSTCVTDQLQLHNTELRKKAKQTN